MVRGSHRTEVGGPFDQFLHLLPGFLVSLLPFGILQSVADSHLVDVGDIKLYKNEKHSFYRAKHSKWKLVKARS